jgi:hypothetical protein
MFVSLVNKLGGVAIGEPTVAPGTQRKEGSKAALKLTIDL